MMVRYYSYYYWLKPQKTNLDEFSLNSYDFNKIESLKLSNAELLLIEPIGTNFIEI